MQLVQEDLVAMDTDTAVAKLDMVVKSVLDVLVDIFNQMDCVKVRFSYLYSVDIRDLRPFY